MWVATHTAALNLGLLMRTLCGVGTPRSLQGRVAALLCCVGSLIRLPETLWDVIWTMYVTQRLTRASRDSSAGLVCRNRFNHGLLGATLATIAEELRPP